MGGLKQGKRQQGGLKQGKRPQSKKQGKNMQGKLIKKAA